MPVSLLQELPVLANPGASLKRARITNVRIERPPSVWSTREFILPLGGPCIILTVMGGYAGGTQTPTAEQWSGLQFGIGNCAEVLPGVSAFPSMIDHYMFQLNNRDLNQPTGAGPYDQGKVAGNYWGPQVSVITNPQGSDYSAVFCADICGMIWTSVSPNATTTERKGQAHIKIVNSATGVPNATAYSFIIYYLPLLNFTDRVVSFPVQNAAPASC